MSVPHPNPPRLAEWLLRNVLPRGSLGDSILGDAREEFSQDYHSSGRGPARRKYWKNTISVAWNFARRGPSLSSARESQNSPSRNTMNAILFDFRNAARLLLRRPALSLIAITSLGLGIGANTSIFSLVNTILLKPLPYPESQELVEAFRIDEKVTGFAPTAPQISGLWAVPYEVHLDWMEMSPVFTAGGGYAGARVTLQGPDGPISLMATLATSGVFSALRVPAALGRPLLPADDAVGAPSVAVLSHGLWQSVFGEDPDVLGRQLDFDGSLYTVVGIMPEGFTFPDPSSQLWGSFPDELKTSPVRNSGYMKVIARLAPGFTLDQARREMGHIATRIGEAHPEEAEHGVGLFFQKDMVIADSGSGLLISLGAVALVLLIACTNIAGLFLLRASEKRREIGVRRALGAGNRRLITQQMSESLLISLLGGAVGLGLASFGMKPFLSLMPSDLPRLNEIEVDGGLLLTALGFSLLTTVVTGFLPAFRTARTSITDVLQEGGRSLAGSRSGNRAQAGLVVSQIALAFVMVIGARLVIRSMMSLMAVDTGFEPESTLVASLTTPPALFPNAVEAESPEGWAGIQAYYRDMEERLRALPGVQHVAAANQMPFVGGWSAPPTTIETMDGPVETTLHFATVTPSWFETMEIPLVAGRLLTQDDRAQSEPVTVISQTLANRIAPGESPLGLRIRRESHRADGDPPWFTIVGIVGDVRYRLNYDPMGMAYLPVAQQPASMNNWVIRSGSDPISLFASVRRVAEEKNPDGSPYLRPLSDEIGGSYAMVSARFSAIFLGSLGVLAGLLAVMGVYGVLAYLVQLRSREIGIQLAMGAEKTRVLRAFLRRGLVMAGIGMGAGTLMALGLGRLMESELFGIQPRDPATFLFAGALMVVAILAASYFPARRAAGLDPVDILKGE